MIYAYITKECEQTAPQEFKEALERAKCYIESTQSLFSFESYRGFQSYYKKSLGNKGRLVAYKQNVKIDGSEHTIMVFIRVFQRENRRYTEFFNDLNNNAPTSLDRYIPDEGTLVSYTQERLKKPDFQPKEECSGSEHGFLNNTGGANDAFSGNNFKVNLRGFIFESQEWIDSMKTHEKFLRDINDTLIDNEFHMLDQNALNGKLIPVENRYNTKIWILYYSNGEWRILANLCSTEEEIEQTRTRWKGRIEAIETLDALRDALRQAVRRGYPVDLLSDLGLWERVEKDPTSNYVLSAEEADILTDFRKGGGGFPLFINGRAGSGKSTVLQYLFTEYFCRAINQDPPIKPPLYFTYSKKLVDNAKGFIKSLLNNDHNLGFDSKNFGTENEDLLESSIREFRSFLLDLVKNHTAKGDVQGLFSRGKYISYTDFKRTWRGWYNNNTRVPQPGISWHIIRSYIQGMDCNEYFEPEDYDELPDNRRSVSREDYQAVYDKIWRRYKEELLDEGYWDDQTLVRYVLANDLIRPLYPGIFCDEVQDFTPIEMEAIRRLCLYYERNPKNIDPAKIPFVFAGDEFQTINPTGFNWNAVRDWIWEKFAPLKNESYQNTDKISFKYLSNNYRSLPHIVKFCNHILLKQMDCFGYKYSPQQPWSPDTKKGNTIRYFQKNNREFWDQVKQHKDIIYILPCGDEEVDDFIQQDPKLQELGNKPLICSTIAIKGVEYDNIIVYGFGGSSSPYREAASQNPSSSLENKYHFHKLYVAASRAKKNLFFVDELPPGQDPLWKLFLEIPNEKDADIALTLGAADINITATEADLQATADTMKTQGLDSRDFRAMQRASDLYTDIQMEDEAAYCTGVALCFQEKYEEAAGIFSKKDSYYNLVWLCYWISGAEKYYKQMVHIADNHKELKESGEYKIVEILSNKNHPPQCRAACLSFFTLSTEKRISYMENFELPIEIDESKLYLKAWGGAVRRIFNLFAQAIQGEYIPESAWDNIAAFHGHKDFEFDPKIFTELSIKIGYAAYNAQEYQYSLKCWTNSRLKESFPYHKEFLRCEMETSVFPENEDLLWEFKDLERLYNEYQKQDKTEWALFRREEHPDRKNTMIHYLLETGKAVEALEHINKNANLFGSLPEETRWKLQGLAMRYGKWEFCYKYQPSLDKSSYYEHLEKICIDSVYKKRFSYLAAVHFVKEAPRAGNKQKIKEIFAPIVQESLNKKDLLHAVYVVSALASRLDKGNEEISQLVAAVIMENISQIPLGLRLQVGRSLLKIGKYNHSITYYQFLYDNHQDAANHKAYAFGLVYALEQKLKENLSLSAQTKAQIEQEIQDINKAVKGMKGNELSKLWTIDELLHVIPTDSEILDQEETPDPEETQAPPPPKKRVYVKRKSTKIEKTYGDYTIKYFPPKKRLTIEDQETGDRLTSIGGEPLTGDISCSEAEDGYMKINNSPINFKCTLGKYLFYFSDDNSEYEIII